MFGYLMGKIFGTRNQRYLKSLRPLLRKINALEPEMQALADEELAPRLAEYRRQAQEDGSWQWDEETARRWERTGELARAVLDTEPGRAFTQLCYPGAAYIPAPEAQSQEADHGE